MSTDTPNESNDATGTKPIRNHVYRAKKPRPTRGGYYNDRMVLWVSTEGKRVQYDSDSIARNGKYPTIDREKWDAWADLDVTDGYPDGDWEVWK